MKQHNADLSLKLHQRHPTVVNLARSLDNGHCVQFSEDNATPLDNSPLEATLTAFLS